MQNILDMDGPRDQVIAVSSAIKIMVKQFSKTKKTKNVNEKTFTLSNTKIK